MFRRCPRPQPRAARQSVTEARAAAEKRKRGTARDWLGPRGASVPMIRVIRQHAMSAIELLGQQDPHQRMRKRQTRQGPFEVAPLQDIRGETIGPADEKGEIASVLQARSEPGRQLAGRHLHAVLVERDYIFASPESRKDSLTLGLDGFGRRLSGRAG